MAIKAKRIAQKYPEDLIHIDRWMCPNCGLIFDFESDPDELGWISYDPPLEHVNLWIDEKGNYHEAETERIEICPRCACNLDKNPLQRIFISATTTLDDIKPIIQNGESDLIEFMVKKLFLKSETSFFCTRTARNPRKKDNFLKPFSVKVSEIRDVRVQKRS